MNLLFLLIFVSLVNCDIYLHNPRGSNNRLNEASRERNKNQRLFDSQNNERGGYNVGSLYYYVNSTLPVEWTQQHSCADQNANCDVILQYMCDEQVRDGTALKNSPTTVDSCLNKNCNTDFQHGMHESFSYYDECIKTPRNDQLFVADQKLRGNTRKYTRQNTNGQKYGYECPEERDYYPNWHPSPWRDIAILTSDTSKCQWYTSASWNTKLWNLPAPVCRAAEHTRDNHLGNTLTGRTSVYNWTVPNHPGEKCIFRIRYNISTSDYESSSQRTYTTSVQDDLAKKVGFSTKSEASARGFVFKNNPKVQVFAAVPSFKLNLNVNTQQFGRVFQDRSHVFHVKQRPLDVSGDSVIHNVNVRGKRGNIVQVYPAVEYDFVPSTVHTTPSELVHFQWTGSNTNPNNNDGEGLAGTDRNNVVLLNQSNLAVNLAHFPFHESTVGAFDITTATKLALLSPEPQLGGHTPLLNDAGTYFDAGLSRVTSSSEWNYMCTRNNNFSNRSQKGKLMCSRRRPLTFILDNQAITVTLPDGLGWMEVPSGALSGLVYVETEVIDANNTIVSSSKSTGTLAGDSWLTDLLWLSVDQFSSPVTITLTSSQDLQSVTDLHIYRTDKNQLYSALLNYWVAIPLQKSTTKTVTFTTNRGGVYALRGYKNSTLSVGSIIGIIIGILAAILITTGVIFGVITYRRDPKCFASKLHYVQRSFASEV